ncbi:MAG: asparaginase [Gaiellaceae bacterium]
MADALKIAVNRGGVAEATHTIHAVAVQNGAVVAEAGDARHICFMRSAGKPFQALPLARARPELDDRDLAIASSSHLGLPEQLEAVRALLAKAPAGEDELECGPDPIHHNCSGKHAGMLALCRAEGWPSKNYRLGDHPVQRGCLSELAAAAEADAREIPAAIDGCGVVTFALPLERMAHAFSRLEQIEGGTRVAAAMRAHPELIRGPGEPDTRLMQTLSGWTAKGGAEGLMCAVSPEGLGIALKSEDGSLRGMEQALAAFLVPLGIPLASFARAPVKNSRGETVGALEPAD